MGKLYVGNLSYECTDEQLKEHFEKVVEVVSVEVVERNGKRLGFGYVEVEGNDIESLIEQLDQTTLLDRTLKVEEQQEKAARGTRAPRAPRARGRARGARGTTGTRGGNNANYRGGKPKLHEGERVETATNAYVGNLPWKYENADLQKLFEEEGLKVNNAQVITRKTRNRVLSKGFGFVEFASALDQQKAIEKFNEKVVEERTLVVKAAWEHQKEIVGDEEEHEEE